MNEELYLKVLKEELVVALGCTEPTAFAICAHKCREILGSMPDRMEVYASGNMIKNVKGVYIPNTPHLKGIETVCLIGALVDSKKNNLELLEDVSEDVILKAHELEDKHICKVYRKITNAKLYVEVKMYKGEESASVELMHMHTNITKICKNGKEIFFNPCFSTDMNSSFDDRKAMSVEGIYNFINTVDVKKLKEILEPQARYNYEIGKTGLIENHGLQVGKTLLNSNPNPDVYDLMKCHAAAGCDARMGGCDKAVVINSGSGNQGMTVSIPLCVYRDVEGLDEETFYRALALSNLIPIHIKTNIGRLSAFCGIASASMGVGAALSYIKTNDLQVIKNTLTNTIANVMGIICDGAKPSCAIKLASCLDAVFLAHKMAMLGIVVEAGTGIISTDIEKTISNMCNIASKAMRETDDMIIDIMTK